MNKNCLRSICSNFAKPISLKVAAAAAGTTMVNDGVLRVRDISRNSFSSKIKARIMTMWKEDYGDAKKAKINMILIDEFGDKIHAKFNAYDIEKYEERLLQGRIYTFVKFKSEQIPNQKYRFTDQTYQLWIQKYTIIEEISAEVKDFPMYIYDFEEYEEVQNYYKNDKFRSMDVIGRLHYYKETQLRTIGDRTTDVRDIYLMNQREELLRVTLWASVCKDIEEAIKAQQKGETAIVMITSLLPEVYLGNYFLRSSSATKIILNNSIREVEEFTKEMKNVDESNIGNRRTIQQIYDVVLGNRTQMDEYWFTGTILDVKHNMEWHYMACGKCRKKVEFKDGKYSCQKCTKLKASEKPSEVMDIEDNDSSIMMIAAFDEAIRNVLDITPEEMITASSHANGKLKGQRTTQCPQGDTRTTDTKQKI